MSMLHIAFCPEILQIWSFEITKGASIVGIASWHLNSKMAGHDITVNT